MAPKDDKPFLPDLEDVRRALKAKSEDEGGLPKRLRALVNALDNADRHVGSRRLYHESFDNHGALRTIYHVEEGLKKAAKGIRHACEPWAEAERISKQLSEMRREMKDPMSTNLRMKMSWLIDDLESASEAATEADEEEFNLDGRHGKERRTSVLACLERASKEIEKACRIIRE